MGTKYVRFCADMFLNSHKLYTMQWHLKYWSYKCTNHYRDDVFSLNNYKLDDYVDRIYVIELEKDITKIPRSTSYFDLHIDDDGEGR